MERERLTITLDKDILQRLDEVIDGINLRNRSHAIESYLERALMPKVSQAIILAGGQGIKMRPLTYEIPKALIPVHNKPLLEYQIELLREHDIRKIILAIGHLGDKIKTHFGNGRNFGVDIHYSHETNPLGTAGALRRAYKLIEPTTTVVLHGDVLVDIDLSELIAFHLKEQTIATIALTTIAEPSAFGSVLLRGSRIVDFIEKPKKGKETSYLVNSGIYIFEPEMFERILSGNTTKLEDMFPKLARDAQLGGFSFEGRWFDVSTPQNYERAIKLWSESV